MEIYQMEKKRLAPIVPQQKLLLVNFLDAHPELHGGKLSNSFSKKTREQLWRQISCELYTGWL
nr:unnamed protein product [Callosobruchus analis]